MWMSENNNVFAKWNKGMSINDVPRFLAIFDPPTYLPTLSYFITGILEAILDTPTYPNIGRH